MHDCPTCGVPLHGHEENCPSCGRKQYVRRDAYFSRLPEQPGINFVPVIVIFVILCVGFFFMAKSSWIGQLIEQGPKVEDPMDKLTYQDARKIIEDKITQGLSAVSATGKFTWKNNGAVADKSVAQPLELDVDTRLSNPEQRKIIIDPVKDYMPKANIQTLIMTDSKSHATWTYSVSPPPMPSNDQTSDQASPEPQK